LLIGALFAIGLLVVVPIFISQTLLSRAGAEMMTASPTTTGQVTYQLDWRWGDAQPDAAGEGWQVTNDRGYRIHVKQGYLVTASAEMIACPHEHTANSASAETMAARVLDLFGARLAYAGHGGNRADASRIASPYVESLSTPATLEIKTVFGVEPVYCQTHYLIAHGVDWAQQLPVDVDMVGKSLFLAGEYWAPGADAATVFIVQTGQAWGTLAEITAPATGDQAMRPVVLLPNQDVVIAITRELGSLFDGVDFMTMTGAEQATTVLRGLANSVAVQVLPVTNQNR
jgi:hypothetical protein